MKTNLLFKKIQQAQKNLSGFVKKTPLIFSERLSEKYQANVYLKREDLQKVRSFKIRGALNKMLSLEKDKIKGVVTASAGNHAQGVAYSCRLMKIKGVIFMPIVTPSQKIDRVKYFGNGYVEVMIDGKDYDEASKLAKQYTKKNQLVYIPAFDDEEVIAGQGTIGVEIYEDLKKIDMVLGSVGGGGLMSGISVYLKTINPKINTIGVESTGTASMVTSLKNGKITELSQLDSFCDGVAVKKVSSLTFSVFQNYVDQVDMVDEGQVATTMIDFFQNEGIITEPAGALPVAGLEKLKNQIKGKTVVCIISGGNMDLLRYPEVQERSLLYQQLKKYYLIEFTQKPGQLKKFVNNVLGPEDDIVLFEYMKKNNKEKGPVLIGIESKNKYNFIEIEKKLKTNNFNFQIVNSNQLLFNFLI